MCHFSIYRRINSLIINSDRELHFMLSLSFGFIPNTDDALVGWVLLGTYDSDDCDAR